MLLAGDEFGRSQHGNNNAYCQDNEINWLNWRDLPPEEQEFLDFVPPADQPAPEHPVLRRTRFLHGLQISKTTGLRDMEWISPGGSADGRISLAGTQGAVYRHVAGRRCRGILHSGRLSGNGRYPVDYLQRPVHTSIPVQMPERARRRPVALPADTARSQLAPGELLLHNGDDFQMEPRAVTIFALNHETNRP